MTTPEAAALLIERGYQVVPVANGSKACKDDGWLNLVFRPEDFAPNDNIGIRSVGGLVVSDADSPEAVALAAAFLPTTGAVWGRTSKLAAKRLYLCADITKTVAYRDAENKTLIELRVNHQDVAPPSVHSSGEVLAWSSEGAPVAVDSAALLRAHQLLATAALWARHYPVPGNRHEPTLAFAGALRRFGLDEAEAAKVVEHAARYAADEKQGDRATEVHSTFRRPDDAPVAGVAKLRELLGKPFIDALQRLWGASDVDGFKLTEAGDAEFFASLHADQLRYDHCVGEWRLFDAHHWRPDVNGSLHRSALDAMRARQAAALKITDTDKRKRHLTWALGGEQRMRQKNMLELAQNIEPLADVGDQWDRDLCLLGVKNGVIDLRTGVLRNGQPEDRITRVVPVDFDSAASMTTWATFVRDVCSDDAELAAYLQVVVGYSLTGLTSEQCFWILYGTGSNGKSTLLETLTKRLLPEHSWVTPFPTKKTGSWSDAVSEYQRASLQGRRLVVASETETEARLNTVFMKSLTGDETITGRWPYGRHFNFKPEAKFFLAVNHKPEIRDESHGMWRRVRLVPFSRTFPPNPQFAEALVSNMPGILRWAVEGAVKYFRDGMVTPQSVLTATTEYQSESNPLVPFFDACCVFDEKHKTRAGVLYDAYRQWVMAGSTEGMSQREFGERLLADARLRRDLDRNKTATYVGIALLELHRGEL